MRVNRAQEETAGALTPGIANWKPVIMTHEVKMALSMYVYCFL